MLQGALYVHHIFLWVGACHPARHHRPAADAHSPAAHQAFLLLRTVFTVAPILFGLDKFAGLLTDWEQYLAPRSTT